MKRVAKAVVGVALAVAGVLGGAATATAAQAAPPAPYLVTAWHDVNVRSCPAMACEFRFMLLAGDSTIAFCWVHGQTITDAGVSNDVWIRVNREDSHIYVSAVYLLGDRYANLPREAECRP